MVKESFKLLESLMSATDLETWLMCSWLQSVTRHFGEHTTRVYVVFDRYIGEDFIKAITRQKRVGKKKPIRKLNDGQHVPLPTMWSQFIALDDNKADLAYSLSEAIMQKGKELPAPYELIAGGGFRDAQKHSLQRELTCSFRDTTKKLIHVGCSIYVRQ